MTTKALKDDGYLDIATSIATLVTEKQKSYGNAVEKTTDIINILYPNGIPTKATPSALIVVRVIDKLMRIATSEGDTDSMGEDPWKDIMGYSLLMLKKLGDERERQESLGEKHLKSIKNALKD